MIETWRLIESGPCDASFNMALDEAIALSVRNKGLPPTLRLYGWDRPSVSLGCFQKVTDIDRAYCDSRGIPVVRRPTGGRAILHGDELTYSFSVRTDTPPFSKGLLDSYGRIGAALGLALGRIGLQAEAKAEREKGSVLAGSALCFRSASYGEILVAGRKVVGSAQKRWDNGLLQQGSLPYGFDPEEMGRVFGKDAGGSGAGMAGLRELVEGFDEGSFRDTLVAAFETVFGVSLLSAPPTQEEQTAALRLAEEKYRHPDWTLGRPGRQAQPPA